MAIPAIESAFASSLAVLSLHGPASRGLLKPVTCSFMSPDDEVEDMGIPANGADVVVVAVDKGEFDEDNEVVEDMKGCCAALL